MREGSNPDKVLPNRHDNAFNSYNFETDNETIRVIDALSKKIKPEIEETCNFRFTCYVGKTKMGSCPCELYK
jgi:succinate dehydrogenase/fumarate reductase-like Fe-S protein